VEVEIRKSVPNEGETIAFILAEAFTEYKSFYTERGFAETIPSAEEIERRFGEELILIASYDGKIVGTVSAVAQGEDLYIRSMGVHPKARGRKIGEKLLEYIEDFARENYYKRLTLSTTPFLDRAIRLYEKFGFVREGTSNLFGTPLLTMKKNL